MTQTLTLAGEFPQATREQWRAAVDQVLGKGKPGADPAELFDKLVTTTYDGIRLGPIAAAADLPSEPGLPGQAPFTRGARAAVTGWDVRQRHAWAEAATANRAVLADLEGGATSILLAVGGAGLPPASMTKALQGVMLDLAGVALEHLGGAATEHVDAASALLDLLDAVPSGERRGCLGLDPVGLLARTGAGDLGAFYDAIVALLPRIVPGVTAMVADGMPFHCAGGSDAQVLGLTAVTYAAHLRALINRGVDPVVAARAISVRLPATSDQLATIAVLRAARRLLGRVSEVAGAAGVVPSVHAIQSPMGLTRRDPWVNVLRSTLACFAAAVGGAESITTLGYDLALGEPDELSSRIARNTQLILLEESHLARVNDPAGGSYAVERFTDDMARAAWAVAQRVDGSGGVEDGLRDGSVLKLLDATWSVRERDIARRKTPLTGVSEFPWLEEQVLVRRPSIESVGGGLPIRRPSAPWEDLRDAADACAVRPAVVLLTLGPAAAHTPRVMFATNLYAAGGIAAPTAEAQEIATAMHEHATTVVCLCSSDAVYATDAAAAVAAARAAGATHVVLAGKAPSSVVVDSVIAAGGDALATLRATHALLGVTL